MNQTRRVARAALGVVLLTACAVVSAQESDAIEGEDAELAELLGVIAEETELATRSKQNADFVPGIVSVLDGDDLRALGAQNALDALALVPGFEVSRDQGGAASLRVRGLEFFFNTGNVKVLVNGVDTSFQVSGQNSALLLIPIELVDRLEVIRGPGSSVHGDFAFTGLVNVVTRQDRSAVSAGVSSGSGRSATASFATDGDFALAANVSANRSDRYDVPHNLESDEERAYGDVTAKWRGLSLRALGLHRGNERLIAPPGQGTPVLTDSTEKLSAFDARYDFTYGPENRATLFANYSRADYDAANDFAAHRVRYGGEATWRFGAHLLLSQISFGGLSIDQARVPQLPPPPPGPRPPNAPPPLQRPASVSDHLPSWSFVLQDSIDLTEKLTFTAGVRYDTLDDLDQRLTPRAAIVYRLDENHTIKAQYAEGFRTPLLVELYATGFPNDRVDFEAIHTREIGYIYRNPRRVLRATVFDADLPNLINPLGPTTLAFGNPGKAATRGLELEWNEQLASWLELVANVSFMDTEDTRGPPRLPRGQTDTGFGEADELANLGLVARPNDAWTLGVHWNHVGDRDSPTVTYDGYDAVNVSAEWRAPWIEGLSIRATVRNALDDDITTIISAPQVQQVRVLDYGERLWFATLEYRFR